MGLAIKGSHMYFGAAVRFSGADVFVNFAVFVDAFRQHNAFFNKGLGNVGSDRREVVCRCGLFIGVGGF